MAYANKVQLITYIDRLGGSDTQALHSVLRDNFPNTFGGVHLLPFYYPMDGEDAGFDPIDHTALDNRLGSWDDVQALGQDYDLMADMIVNHMSAQSNPFKDVLAKGQDSEFWDLFLTKGKVSLMALQKKILRKSIALVLHHHSRLFPSVIRDRLKIFGQHLRLTKST